MNANATSKRMLFIKLPYWLGIAADALWAVALFVPSVYGILTGRDNFEPDFELRLSMSIGGILMFGWTILLLWAVREPIERRFVILLTAIPVVLGLLILAFIGAWNGNTSQIWIVIKCSILLVSMITSYFLARNMESA